MEPDPIYFTGLFLCMLFVSEFSAIGCICHPRVGLSVSFNRDLRVAVKRKCLPQSVACTNLRGSNRGIANLFGRGFLIGLVEKILDLRLYSLPTACQFPPADPKKPHDESRINAFPFGSRESQSSRLDCWTLDFHDHDRVWRQWPRDCESIQRFTTRTSRNGRVTIGRVKSGRRAVRRSASRFANGRLG